MWPRRALYSSSGSGRLRNSSSSFSWTISALFLGCGALLWVRGRSGGRDAAELPWSFHLFLTSQHVLQMLLPLAIQGAGLGFRPWFLLLVWDVIDCLVTEPTKFFALFFFPVLYFLRINLAMFYFNSWTDCLSDKQKEVVHLYKYIFVVGTIVQWFVCVCVCVPHFFPIIYCSLSAVNVQKEKKKIYI